MPNSHIPLHEYFFGHLCEMDAAFLNKLLECSPFLMNWNTEKSSTCRFVWLHKCRITKGDPLWSHSLEIERRWLRKSLSNSQKKGAIISLWFRIIGIFTILGGPLLADVSALHWSACMEWLTQHRRMQCQHMYMQFSSIDFQ